MSTTPETPKDPVTDARELLIEARQCLEKDRPWGAVMCLKWAMERLLPEGQRDCTQTLNDDDPNKTLQGFLDNLVKEVTRANKSPGSK